MSLVLKPFHELLEMHFIIPPYQRGYRWESRQVEELLDDLLDFVKSLKTKRNRNNEGHEPYYCLQPITVVRHPENVFCSRWSATPYYDIYPHALFVEKQ